MMTPPGMLQLLLFAAAVPSAASLVQLLLLLSLAWVLAHTTGTPLSVSWLGLPISWSAAARASSSNMVVMAARAMATTDRLVKSGSTPGDPLPRNDSSC
jgi:hypothetical protein